jgi:hypothetical protein
MKQQAPFIVRFTQTVNMIAPGLFSVALIVLGVLSSPSFSNRPQSAMPMHLSVLIVGLLGITLQIVIGSQNRRIRELEAIVRKDQRVG